MAREHFNLKKYLQRKRNTASVVSYTYDRTGHVASITDPAGNRRSFAYNDAGELEEETDIRGNTTRYEYNLLGQLSSITDGMGRKIRHYYLPGGRLEKTVYPDGREMRYAYDKLGRVVRKTDGQGYTLNYTYDCMGRVLSIASSAGQKKTYTYDAAGNVASMKDANGNTTTYEYTLSGRLKAVTDALGNRAEYAYDKEDRLVYICQMGKEGEENRETFYERDPLGQVECIRDALGSEERFSYDALGRTILKTDREGYRTEYEYTPDGKVKHIAYGDGTGVEMEYTALRQLCAVKDWLGETRIERDEAGAPTEITDHKGRTVSYEWGSMGERRSITYPDGRKALYEYDGLLRLQKMQIQRDGEEGGSLSGISLSGRTAGRPGEINYKYDEMGRLAEKLLPEGMRTRWLYDERGQLRELVHEDRYGVLDRYQYEYDLMGNKTAITKERRGLKEESGRYEYGYDSLSRLASVSKDGDAVRAYAYDSFGNRSSLEDFGRGRNTSYHYDALNRLVYKEEGGARTDYGYDKRGNLVREETEGRLLHGYEYGAMNRLSKSWNDKGGESLYLYNGLGQRMGRSINGREEDYLLDLTKPYHNLMEIYKGEECSQRFYLDGTAAAVEEASKIQKTQGRRPFPGLHYYLKDELGSPVRVSGYGEKESASAGRNNYLTYGYDEFGNDPGEELEEAGIPNPYDRQGMEQPLGYTGYRYDEGSGTYFAQAREYQSKSGRFMAEDVVKGNGAKLRTLNQYNYCLNNSLSYVDWDGKSAAVAVLVIAGVTLLVSGCGAAEEDVVKPIIKPLPSPTPTLQPTPASQPTPTPVPQPTLTPSPIETYPELTEEEKIFVATVCGESIGEGEVAWQFVANTIMNRLESKHWSKYNSVTDIIAYTGYDAYSRQTPEYCKAMNYLNNRTYDNDLYENVITIILPIYNDECDDMSYGATMYYNPKLVTPNWNFAQLEELQIEGLESDEFKAYRYIDDCAE